MLSVCTHNPFTRKAVAMADEIIFAASRAIENHNDRDLDILVKLQDYHSGKFNQEFEKICRIEYVGSLTEEDKSNVMYMWARSEAAKRKFDNPEIDYKGVLDDPGMKKLSVELRKLKKLQHHHPLHDFEDNYTTLSPLPYEQDHQGFKDSPNLVEDTFLHDDNETINERQEMLGSNSAQHHRKTKRFAKEPEVYARQVKKCPRCFSVNVKFKYLNNKKLNQPRYLCLSCNNQFTHGGKVAPARVDLTTTCLGDITLGFNGGDGVTGKTIRKRKAQEPERFVGLKKECPNCHSEDAEFKYLNNRKEDQPRYRCLLCKHLFQFPPKRTRLIDAEKCDTPLHVPAVCELPDSGSSGPPSAVIKGNDTVTESSTLHLEQNQQPFELEGCRKFDCIEEAG